MKQSLRYINQGRYGYVVYEDKQGEIQLYYEFGGGNCIAILNVPTVADWETTTSRRITERQPILQFIAERATLDQAPGGYFKLSDNFIEILK